MGTNQPHGTPLIVCTCRRIADAEGMPLFIERRGDGFGRGRFRWNVDDLKKPDGKHNRVAGICKGCKDGFSIKLYREIYPLPAGNVDPDYWWEGWCRAFANLLDQDPASLECSKKLRIVSQEDRRPVKQVVKGDPATEVLAGFRTDTPERKAFRAAWRLVQQWHGDPAKIVDIRSLVTSDDIEQATEKLRRAAAVEPTDEEFAEGEIDLPDLAFSND